MSLIVMTDAGVGQILQCYFAATDLWLRLYTNQPSLNRNTTFGDFTEATSGGYESIGLSAGDWVYEGDNDPVYVSYAEQTFTFSGGLEGDASIYGWYITENGVVVCMKELASPVTPTTPGDNLKITPILYASGGIPI